MNRSTIILVLFAAALLEAAGDAVVRKGLHGSALSRTALLAAGALVLLAYGCVVNSPPWAFSRLLGVYVVFFFLVAQAIGWLFFGEVPDGRIWLGGACIAIGGVIISAGRL